MAKKKIIKIIKINHILTCYLHYKKYTQCFFSLLHFIKHKKESIFSDYESVS